MNEGRTGIRATLAASAVTLVSVITLSSCSGFPVAPSGLPAAWEPTPSPSALPQGQLDSPLGFTVDERASVRVRPETCTHLYAGNGVILDDHTIVTSAVLLAEYESVALALSDGTDITAASTRTSADGKLEFITTVETLPGAAPLSLAAPAMGDQVRIVAFPPWSDFWTSETTIGAAQTADASLPYFAFDVQTLGSPGLAGAGVYGADSGLLVGILVNLDSTDSAPVLVPVDALRGLLADPTQLTDHAATTC